MIPIPPFMLTLRLKQLHSHYTAIHESSALRNFLQGLFHIPHIMRKPPQKQPIYRPFQVSPYTRPRAPSIQPSHTSFPTLYQPLQLSYNGNDVITWCRLLRSNRPHGLICKDEFSVPGYGIKYRPNLSAAFTDGYAHAFRSDSTAGPFAYADEGNEVISYRCLSFERDHLFCFVERWSSTFGVAEFDDRAAKLFEHQGGDFAGEGACVFVVAILSAEKDRREPTLVCELILVGEELMRSWESRERWDNEEANW